MDRAKVFSSDSKPIKGRVCSSDGGMCNNGDAWDAGGASCMKTENGVKI